jgi:hypothetical protein
MLRHIPANSLYSAEQFITGVVDTGDKYSFANISENFRKKFKTAPREYLGAWGTLIHEKPEVENLVSHSFKTTHQPIFHVSGHISASVGSDELLALPGQHDDGPGRVQPAHPVQEPRLSLLHQGGGRHTGVTQLPEGVPGTFSIQCSVSFTHSDEGIFVF